MAENPADEIPENTENPEKVILNIGTFSSKCMNCGVGADLSEVKHETAMGWGETRPACGAVFTHVTSDYFGGHLERMARNMRPDLEWISPQDAHTYTVRKRNAS